MRNSRLARWLMTIAFGGFMTYMIASRWIPAHYLNSAVSGMTGTAFDFIGQVISGIIHGIEHAFSHSHKHLIIKYGSHH